MQFIFILLLLSTWEFSLRVTNSLWETVLKEDLKVYIYQLYTVTFKKIKCNCSCSLSSR